MLNATQTKAFLKPYLNSIIDCIENGFDEYKKRLSGIDVKISPTARSILLRDLIVDNVKALIDGNGEVMREHRKGLLFILLVKPNGGPTFAIRFKKLNKKLLTSNIPTRQSINFSAQIPIFELKEDIIYLNAGYQLITKTILGGHKNYITCPRLKMNEWELEISYNETDNETKIHTLPKENTNEKSKLRIKPAPRKQSDGKSEND